MHVIDVIPLSRTAPGVLTYRSKAELPVGTIVSITIRKTETQGIVISSTPVLDAKEMLKHARFLLSKSVPAASGTLPRAVLTAAERTAEYHATSTGAVLTTLFNEHIRAGVLLPADGLTPGVGFSRTRCELPHSERAHEYAALIHKSIKRNASVLLVTPTIPELIYWKNAFASFKPLVVSGALTGLKRSDAITKALTHTGLIIVTPSFSWLPVEKLGLIILDRVSAGTYTLPKRPYLSIPYATTVLAEERGIPFVLGDFPLPLEYRENPESGLSEIQTPVTLFDARSKKPDEITLQKHAQGDDDVPWAAVPKGVMAAVKKEIESGGKTVLIGSRKGYSPAVVCRDCGQAQHDDRGMAYSFSQAKGERVFRTSDGHVVKAAKKCQRCESWNLLPLGIGIERIEEEIRAAIPEANIVVVSPESVASPRKAKDALQTVNEPGTVVVGTEALLPWLYVYMQKHETLPLGVIVSADSLLSQPFWRSRERFVRLAYFLRGITRELILVTRHPEDTAVDAVMHPESNSFWKEELMLRRALSYPPYGTILTLTVEGNPDRVQTETKELKRQFGAYSPTLLPTRQAQGVLVRGVVVLCLSEDSWPDVELSRQLRILPPTIRVRVDPESLY